MLFPYCFYNPDDFVKCLTLIVLYYCNPDPDDLTKFAYKDLRHLIFFLFFVSFFIKTFIALSMVNSISPF